MTGASDVAEFSRTPVQFTLTVTPAGSGNGSVTDDQGGIMLPAGTDCSHPYNEGTAVTLTAHPASGSQFTGWSGGGCSGTGTCTVIDELATRTSPRPSIPSRSPLRRRTR